MSKNLSGTKTHDNLKAAFAGESQANRRYLYFAKRADIEGFPDIGGLFRDVAEGETGHAHGHLEVLAEVGDPVTGVPIGSPVAGSPTCLRKSRWPCAWPVSPSAVSRNRPAMSAWPSTSAVLAK